MEELIKGDVVVVSFPFTDLSASKKRPALVLAKLQGDDLILCQITGKEKDDKYAVSLENSDFKKGSLNVSSIIRPNKLVTTNKKIINYKIGSLKENKLKEVNNKLINIFKE